MIQFSEKLATAAGRAYRRHLAIIPDLPAIQSILQSLRGLFQTSLTIEVSPRCYSEHETIGWIVSARGICILFNDDEADSSATASGGFGMTASRGQSPARNRRNRSAWFAERGLFPLRANRPPAGFRCKSERNHFPADRCN